MTPRFTIVSAILILWSSSTIAGAVQPAPIVVDLDNMFAQGDMWTARQSGNDVELIGCGFREFDDGSGNSFEFGFCQATDVDENNIVCFTQNPVLVEKIAGTSDFSFVTFSWDENHECNRVGFSTQSFYLPKFKIQKGMGDDD